VFRLRELRSPVYPVFKPVTILRGPEVFLTHSLRTHPAGAAITRVLAAALDAVDPYAAILRTMLREGNLLRLGKKTYDLTRLRHIWIVGAGIAGFPMVQAVVNVISERIAGGIVMVKDGHVPGLFVFTASQRRSPSLD
jgi:glycerate 2-kinase